MRLTLMVSLNRLYIWNLAQISQTNVYKDNLWRNLPDRKIASNPYAVILSLLYVIEAKSLLSNSQSTNSIPPQYQSKILRWLFKLFECDIYFFFLSCFDPSARMCCSCDDSKSYIVRSNTCSIELPNKLNLLDEIVFLFCSFHLVWSGFLRMRPFCSFDRCLCWARELRQVRLSKVW